MRLFGFDLRSIFAQGRQGPRQGPAVVYAYTDADRVRSGYAAALIILEHLMDGRTGSRREMLRSGMSDTRWRRGAYLLQAAGVIAATKAGAPLELTAKNWETAEALLLATRDRLIANTRKPSYTLPMR